VPIAVSSYVILFSFLNTFKALFYTSTHRGSLCSQRDNVYFHNRHTSHSFFKVFYIFPEKKKCVNGIVLCVSEFLTIYHIRYTTYEHSDGRNCPEVFLDFLIISSLRQFQQHLQSDKLWGKQLALGEFPFGTLLSRPPAFCVE